MYRGSPLVIALLGVVLQLCQAQISPQEVNQVLTATGYSQLDPATASIIANGINGMTQDRNEAAMFLAQVIHESGGFRYREEIGGANQAYAPYYGRGYIQLTWDYNYRAASADLFGDDRLMRDPGIVSRDPQISMAVSVWFWTKNVRPAGGVTSNNFGLTTKAINGGIESSSSHPTAVKRYELYRKAAQVLGVYNVAVNQY